MSKCVVSVGYSTEVTLLSVDQAANVWVAWCRADRVCSRLDFSFFLLIIMYYYSVRVLWAW